MALLPLQRKSVVLWISIALHRPWPGLNPRTLDPVAGSLFNDTFSRTRLHSVNDTIQVNGDELERMW
jgi:hypothetical protein